MAMTSPRRSLRIGQLARACALSPDTLRHYERLGLLPHPPRTSGGFREYPEETPRRIRVIQRSLTIGFTLAELAAIFHDRSTGRAPCRRVRALAAAKLEALEAKLAELGRLRTALRRTLVAWDHRLASTAGGHAAGLLDSLAEADHDPERIAVGRAPPRRVRKRHQSLNPAGQLREGK
jgi:MerR family copper efflux transcriptional regulator